VIRWFVFAIILAAALMTFGLLGAAAFNPDDGVLLHNEPLWRMFGISAYLGVALVCLIPVVGLVGLVLRAGRKRSLGT
jgi:hypothetical protein